ncbi:Allantoinase [Streptomyces tendae]
MLRRSLLLVAGAIGSVSALGDGLRQLREAVRPASGCHRGRDRTGVRGVRLGGDHVVLPGLVDTHVHVNDPGRTEWEGFWTATRAAAAGGITTLVDMPLNSIPPTTTVDNLRTKREVAADKAHIDVGFWGGALPDNVKDLRPLHEAGVFGFKAFLSPSGVDEFPHLDQEQLARSLAEIAAFDGLLIVHAEDPHHLAAAPQQGGPSTRTSSPAARATPRTPRSRPSWRRPSGSTRACTCSTCPPATPCR